jgi:predicted alpha/beta-hydrolase family hydrolase
MAKKRKAETLQDEARDTVQHIEFEIPFEKKPLSACLTIVPNQKPETIILFFHGSGGDMYSSNLTSLTSEIVVGCENVGVFRITTKPPNFSWRVRAAKEALNHVLSKDGHFSNIKNVYSMGRSMGARVACELAITEKKNLKCILMAFPFDNPGSKTVDEQFRGELINKLDALEVPMLFVAGDRDEFCPMKKLDKALTLPKARKDSLVFANVGHSLTAGTETRNIEKEITKAIKYFLTHDNAQHKRIK